MKEVLLVDDHVGARHRLTEVLERAFEGVNVHPVSTLAEARVKIADCRFDLIVLDLSLPDGAGDDFLSEILTEDPNAYIVIATIHDESERLVRALENGAKGYLLKEQSIRDLTESFIGIQAGRPPLTPAITRKLIEIVRGQGITPAPSTDATSATVSEDLTSREREVLSLIARGFSRPEIAGFLDISRHTVATHIGKIYAKLEISSRSEAAIYAKQNGMV